MTATVALQSSGSQTPYLRNMARLWRIDPQLAMRIDAVPESARPPVETTRSGHHSVSIKTADNDLIRLNSRYDPVREAEKLAERVDVDEQYCFIIAGFGLGYHIRAVYERLGADGLVIACEPSIPLLAAAFASVDLSDILSTGRLVVLTDTDKNHVHERLKPHTALLLLGTRFVTHPPSQRVAPGFHAQMRRLITDFAAYSRTTVMTLVSNARITCRNVANNLVHLVTTSPIDPLRNRFANIPAVIVSAGPSLRKNINQLSGFEDRAVICAVQTTLKPLLERGIRPRFVTSLDFHEISARYFDGLDRLDDVHLVAEPKVTWHVTDHYRGPIHLTDNDFARLLLGDALAGRCALPAGATVAHLAFYLARFLGCDPIILIGQDLAFTGHVFYVPGVQAHRDWDSELNRFGPLETREWERIARNRPILRKVESVTGQLIYTDELLFTYLEQFEKDIATTQARVINATEGGARIRGAEALTLRDTLNRFCTRPIPSAALRFDDIDEGARGERLAEARRQLSSRIDEVAAMKSVCGQLIELLDQLTELIHDPARFNRLLVRVDELRAHVNQSHRAYRIISAASQMAELRRFSADRKLSRHAGDECERARRQLRRDIQYVTDVGDGADWMLDTLNQALDRINTAATQPAADGARQ